MKNEPTYAESALIEAFEKFPGLPTHILVAGNRSGELPLQVHFRFPPVPLTVHVFDVHHARAVMDHLGENHVNPRQIVVCAADIPSGPYDLALFMTTPRSMPAELVLDQLEDIYSNMAEGGTFLASFEGDADAALKTLKLVFPSVHPLVRTKHVAVFFARRGAPLARRRDFSATWSASVPGGPVLEFTSLPGCFCHRRADAGGLALAEVASRDVDPGSDILDMGCGCGLVGLLVADAQRRADPATKRMVTLIDSHARALAAAKLNAERFGLADRCRFILSDDGLPRGETAMCGLFVGNPPYYSDYRIAETFLSTAYTALRPGGRCLTVVKTATGLLALQEKYFRHADIVPRRGYAVLSSIR